MFTTDQVHAGTTNCTEGYITSAQASRRGHVTIDSGRVSGFVSREWDEGEPRRMAAADPRGGIASLRYTNTTSQPRRATPRRDAPHHAAHADGEETRQSARAAPLRNRGDAAKAAL